MKIELIPVIEITYFNSGIAPSIGPNWEHLQEWDDYAKLQLKKAGFPDPFQHYEKGNWFYQPEKITPANLKKLIVDWFEDYDGTNLDDILPFYGGYILRVNNKDIYFPQCCGDLGDIVYWKKIITSGKNAYYNGHPAPILSFTNTEITFTFDETDEQFAPPVPKGITLPINLLKDALEVTLLKLKEFEKNILAIKDEIKIDLKGADLSYILIHRNFEIGE